MDEKMKDAVQETFFKPKPPKPPTPPAPEIDCIITTKVYDACRQQECEFFEFAWELPDGWDEEDVTFSFARIVPNSVEYEVLNRELINGGPLARIQIEVCARVELFVVNAQGIEVQVIPSNGDEFENIVCFEKDVILYMPELDRMEAIAEAIFQVAGDPILEFPDTTEDGDALAFIPIGAFIILKSVAEVQLLVPTFGFCPTPPLCEEFPDVDPCEEFDLLPFPDFYPPQPDND
ncbi:hypothetical protein HYG86_06350 [Alkalicella caledoniensis]|uniref:Uncharacterized protein n=1 Tax=Alkalicella caledoniensis TaxID=2731377 RepID=A0A7G9W6V6_ALKCA|nr:hypothetical protein [Alkalicella caledoniensis]QNO14418.1 hypothetical protein HYG86_06350 [Alkalicella caledoniensis]